jgi:hypothetical protein
MHNLFTPYGWPPLNLLYIFYPLGYPTPFASDLRPLDLLQILDLLRPLDLLQPLDDPLQPLDDPLRLLDDPLQPLDDLLRPLDDLLRSLDLLRPLYLLQPRPAATS